MTQQISKPKFNTALQQAVREALGYVFLEGKWIKGRAAQTDSQFATRAGVTPSALSQWLAGKYNADPSTIETAFADALAGKRRSVRVATAKPLETSVTTQVMDALDFTHATGGIVVITGPAGVGKTVALAMYGAANSRNHFVAITPDTAHSGGLRKAVWESVGSPIVPRGKTTLDAIVSKLTDSERVLVLDDAHLLTMTAWNWFTALHNATGIGIALVGNPEMLKMANKLEQWSTRISNVITVNFAEDTTGRKADTTLLALTKHLAAHWIEDDSDREAIAPALEELTRKTRNPRVIMQLLRAIRYNLSLGTPAHDAVALAVDAKKLPFTLTSLAALGNGGAQ